MATREVLIPLKKHLVKYCQFDIEQIFSECDEFYSKERYRVSRILSNLDFYLPLFLREKFRLYNRNSLLAQGVEISILPSRRIKNIDNAALTFLENGYVLVKIRIISPSFRAYTKEEINDARENPFCKKSNMYKSINDVLHYVFLEYVLSFIHCNCPTKKLEIIYNNLGLTEEDYKKSTLLKYYHRNKHKTYLMHQSSFKYQIDPHIHNAIIFSILKQHYLENQSYAKIAGHLGFSKSKISRICKDKKAINLYRNIIRHHTSYHDYSSSVLRNKSY